MEELPEPIKVLGDTGVGCMLIVAKYMPREAHLIPSRSEQHGTSLAAFKAPDVRHKRTYQIFS
jgi:hypothetical protein